MALVAGLKTRVNAGTYRKKPLNFRQVKQVQKIINADKKLKIAYNSISQSNIIATNPLFLEVTRTTQGLGDSNRTETDIKLLSYRLSFAFFREGTSTSIDPVYCRVMVVRGYRPLVVADMPTDVISTPDRDIMQVYYDKVIAFGPNQTTLGVAQSMLYNMDIKKKFKTSKIPHLNVGYENTDTNAVNNPIYLYVLDELTGSNNEVQVRGFASIKFYDKE